MKHLLLFFQLKLAKRLRVYSIMSPVFCLSDNYGYKELASAKEYVLFPSEISGGKIKNYLLIEPSKIGCTCTENSGIIYWYYKQFIRIFNVDIQWLTGDKNNAILPFFLTPHIPFPLSPDQWSSLLKTIRGTLFYEKTYEHFYRLRSLIQHAPQSHQYKKRQKRSGVYFRKTE